MYIHNGDITADDGPITLEGGLLVAGSVYGRAQVEAGGPILIRGSVRDATIRSAGGSITVRGEVAGSAPHKAALQARGDVTCGNLRNARVQTGGDLHLQVRARTSLLVVEGNIYLPHFLQSGLLDVQLMVGGGLVPRLMDAATLDVAHGERQQQRVARQLEASVALHGTPPFDFRSCTILDLSPSGVACRLPAALAAVALGTVLQLKFVLPEDANMLFAITRVARNIEPGVVGLAFLQLMERDRQHLGAFCLQTVLGRAHGVLGLRTQRRNRDRALEAAGAAT